MTLLSNSDMINKNYRNEEPASLKLTKDQNVLDSNTNHNIVIRGDSLDSKSRIESDKLLQKQSLRREVIPRGTSRSESSSIRDEIYSSALAKFGNNQEALAVLWIVKNESGFSPLATNGSCLGLFQRYYPNFTTEEREAYLQDVQRQIDDGFSYIESGSRNFHTPTEAKYFWEVTSVERTGKHWY